MDAFGSNLGPMGGQIFCILCHQDRTFFMNTLQTLTHQTESNDICSRQPHTTSVRTSRRLLILPCFEGAAHVPRLNLPYRPYPKKTAMTVRAHTDSRFHLISRHGTTSSDADTIHVPQRSISGTSQTSGTADICGRCQQTSLSCFVLA